MKKALIISLSLFLVACSAKHEQSKETPVHQKYFVKGNPLSLLNGSVFDDRAPFTRESAKMMADYSLLTFVEFVEKEETRNETKNIDDIEKENKAQDRDRQIGLDLQLEFRELSNGEFSLGTRGELIRFNLQMTGSNLVPVEIWVGNASAKFQTLHWSINEDQTLISLLGYIDTPDTGRSLTAFYFVKNQDFGKELQLNPKYIYSSGAGQASQWPTDKPLELKICNAKQFKNYAQAAAEDWASKLVGRLDFRLQVVTSFPPFTDLNYKCIYSMDAYLTEQQANMSEGGVTITLTGGVRRFDSDIILFPEEIKKVGKVLGESSEDMWRRRLVKHEIGHFLGLGHIFDGTNSIMSYRSSADNLWPYDIDAIQALYPLK